MADQMTLADPNMPWFSVKEAVLPFARFPGVDTILGPEMRSTGEVMGWDVSFARAFLKAQMGAGTELPTIWRKVFLSIRGRRQDPGQLLTRPRVALLEHGAFPLVATLCGTASNSSMTATGWTCETVNKVYEGAADNVVDMPQGWGTSHLVIEHHRRCRRRRRQPRNPLGRAL